ncbi:MAG: hypothetical protein K9I85_10090 [Saprospiraceae bacterium]|nr:hypothetical protein [Saprospiraceae bacterium]
MLLIADKITNLTAARYFAARGANWLIFDPSSISIPEIQAIRGWVEGPDSGIYLPLGLTSMEEDILSQIQPEGIMLGHFAEQSGLPKDILQIKEWRPEQGDDGSTIADWIASWPHAVSHVLRLEEWSPTEILPLLQSIGPMQNLVVQIPPRTLIQESGFLDQVSGICLIAPDEEEVGLLAFDDMDEAIDLVEPFLA